MANRLEIARLQVRSTDLSSEVLTSPLPNFESDLPWSHPTPLAQPRKFERRPISPTISPPPSRPRRGGCLSSLAGPTGELLWRSVSPDQVIDIVVAPEGRTFALTLRNRLFEASEDGPVQRLPFDPDWAVRALERSADGAVLLGSRLVQLQATTSGLSSHQRRRRRLGLSRTARDTPTG